MLLKGSIAALVLLTAAGGSLVVSCGGASGGAGVAAPKYPRRGPGCKLVTYSSPKPGVEAWDDLGVAEIGCHIETSRAECLARLRAEACRMGGDIIYDVPKKALRPKEQAMVYRARVAHTRAKAEQPEKAAKPGEEAPPPATDEESAGPVIPLGAAAPEKTKTKTDAGGGDADGGQPETAPSRFF